MPLEVLPHLDYLDFLALQSSEDLLHGLRLHFFLHRAHTQSDHVVPARVVIFFLAFLFIGFPSLLVAALLLETGGLGLALHKSDFILL
jgi:hypothetical protein